MPGSYLIDVPQRIVFSRGWGVLTDGEILEHGRALRADPRFEPGFRQVLDFRELTEILVTSAGVTTCAQHNPFHRDARRAVVVVTDEAYGLMRMFELHADPTPDQFKLVRDLPSAMSWVGLDPTTPWPAQPPDATFSAP